MTAKAKTKDRPEPLELPEAFERLDRAAGVGREAARALRMEIHDLVEGLALQAESWAEKTDGLRARLLALSNATAGDLTKAAAALDMVPVEKLQSLVGALPERVGGVLESLQVSADLAVEVRSRGVKGWRS